MQFDRSGESISKKDLYLLVVLTQDYLHADYQTT